MVLTLALVTSALAVDAANPGRLPGVHVLTTLKSGEWEDVGELIGEALDEIRDYADEREIKLQDTSVVIYERAEPTTFRARIGYVVDHDVRPRPGRYGKSIELRLLKGPAYVASGSAADVAAIRRKVLDRLAKPGVRRLKGVETIEFFDGDVEDKDTKVEVYGPLR